MTPILNVGLVAHVDAGKTTLTERLLCTAGALRVAGNVDDGTTQTDFLSVERARGISVRASSASLAWHSTHINLVDTPGHVDFSGEVERAFSALDAAVLVVSSVEGIQAQTETLLDALEAEKLPFLVFINKLDRAGSDYAAILSALSQRIPRRMIPYGKPSGEGSDDCIVTLPTSTDWRETMATASDDDTLVMRLLDGETVPDTELNAAMRRTCTDCRIVLVLCGSSKYGVGVETLLDTLAAYYTPDPPDASTPLAGIVYKVEHDPSLGKLAHTRLFSGSLRSRDTVRVPRTGALEKITQIRAVAGRKSQDVREVLAGDIAAISGLTSVRAGDIIGQGKIPRVPVSMTAPLLTVKAVPEEDADIMALLGALRELAEEDPLLELVWVPEKREIHLRTTGHVQLEVLSVFLRERYHLTAHFEEPSILYKETPIRSAVGFDSYTMPKPCWAEIEFHIEPLPRGSGFRYTTDIDPRKIEYRYQAHIETAVPRALTQGLFGWEVTDLAVTLTGGSWHHIHTHPLDFFVATPMALMDGLRNAGTKLLEPILEVRFRAPEEFLGRTVSLLVARRGEFDSPFVRGADFTLSARVPAEEALDFPVEYAALTGGRGRVGTRFLEYADCPPGHGHARERFGVDPLDRPKWILHARGAYAANIE
ncbi:MAG: translation factor GTPase family protein [Clostridiaceae bacterium]|nr:translation factor GTPase family protein [Clostridiaceae bacterium]